MRCSLVRKCGIEAGVVAYIERATDRLIRDLLRELPALLLVGPRASGKTTTAMRHAATVVRLDHPGEAAAFAADPDAALRGLPEPVLLDEWQATPGVLGAVKRAVDTNSRPGRYLLTGSVHADLEASTWPGTGRLVRVPMFGLSIAELQGRPQARPLIDRLLNGAPIDVPPGTPDLRGYVELALQGGFPQAALALTDRTRRLWLASYVEQLLTRDAQIVDGARDPAKLRRFVEAYASSSAGAVADQTLLDAAGVNRKTAVAYEQLLITLWLVERVPPWTSNRLARLTHMPKRYLTEPALLAGILGVDSGAVVRDGDLLGRVLDTLVAAQLRAQLPIAEATTRLFHVRQEQGRREVDLVLEAGAGKVVAIEVKADSAPRPDAARHLGWLRDRLGDRFIAGLVLHTGPRVFELGDRLIAAPISTLWT
jgi:predicted AAA+ superfamily ATPase